MAVDSAKTLIFRYKQGSSFLYRLPSWFKILFIFTAGCTAFLLPLNICLAGIAAASVLSFYSGFSMQDQAATGIPVLYYAILLWFAGCITKLTAMYPHIQMSAALFLPETNDILLCIRVFFSLLVTSLFFRTTTPLSLRTGIGQIEHAVRSILPVSKQNSFTESFSFFMLFIPRVLDIWNSIEYAWKARGGKNGIRKIRILIPVLLSLCLHQVWTTSRAVRSRQI